VVCSDVVVVVTGGACVVCDADVVVVDAAGVLSPFTVEQAENDKRPAAARHGTMSLYINTIPVWFIP
jgi:hypothetical protein